MEQVDEFRKQNNSQLKCMRVHRFGSIFFNIAVACLVLVGIAILATIITPVLYVGLLFAVFAVWLIMVVFTIGLVYVIPNNPATKIWSFLGELVKFNQGEKFFNFICVISCYLKIYL